MNLSENLEQSSLPRPWVLDWISVKLIIENHIFGIFWGAGNPANIFFFHSLSCRNLTFFSLHERSTNDLIGRNNYRLIWLLIKHG